MTEFQMERLKQYLGRAAPAMAVFAPNPAEGIFRLPSKRERSKAREKFGVSEGEIHIVYAGRWLATKGICQLLRVLNVWPLANVKVTLVGNFTPRFPVMPISASHLTFESFFSREFIRLHGGGQTRLMKAMGAKGLREVLWSADVFVYPSVHADENFGLAPREAALCGLPVVVTDFCGLHPLTEHMPWGGIDTDPTLQGPRYGLRQFRELVGQAIQGREEGFPQDYRVSVMKECDPRASKMRVLQAAELLLKEPLGRSYDMDRTEKQASLMLLRHAHEKILKALTRRKKDMSDGAFVDGTGPYNERFPHNELFRAIQGIYTTMDETPVVQRGTTWRGFYRIALWNQEKALVEFGFPGPRVRHYDSKGWDNLVSCVKVDRTSEVIMQPMEKKEISLVQELVDFGYVVPEMC